MNRRDFILFNNVIRSLAFVGVLHQQNIHRFNMRQGKTQEGFPNEIMRRLKRKLGAKKKTTNRDSLTSFKQMLG